MAVYANIDVEMPFKKRIRRAGVMAEFVYLRSILFCKRLLTDGVIDESQLDVIAIGLTHDVAIGAVDSLVQEELLERTNDGWRIPFEKWKEWQTTKEEVEEKRAAQSEGGKAGAQKRWGNSKKTKPKKPDRLPVASAQGQPKANLNLQNSQSQSHSTEPKPSYPPFPPELNSDQCRKAISDWVEHRKQKRKPATEQAVEKLLKQWAPGGGAAFVEAIEHSIANGWDGVFSPKPKSGSNHANQRSPARREAPREEYEDLPVVDGSA